MVGRQAALASIISRTIELTLSYGFAVSLDNETPYCLLSV
jgi:hypothetical protein